MHRIRYVLFAVGIVGLLVSSYLLYTYVTGGPILCGDGSCEVVRASEYASIVGIPTPLYGVVFYVLLIVGALLWVPPYEARRRYALLILTGVGLVVSFGLTYIEAFVIHAWCRWCVVSAVLTVIAFLAMWMPLYNYKQDDNNGN